uniref:Uncharacterized protein n=1 Tax=Oryza punctata TaxID=4537 RepID=A0A0E0LU36_ORYPU
MTVGLEPVMRVVFGAIIKTLHRTRLIYGLSHIMMKMQEGMVGLNGSSRLKIISREINNKPQVLIVTCLRERMGVAALFDVIIFLS